MKTTIPVGMNKFDSQFWILLHKFNMDGTIDYYDKLLYGISPTHLYITSLPFPLTSRLWNSVYRQVSNISHTLVGNKIVDHSDVVGASPVGAARTTSSFSTQQLASLDWAKTTTRRDEKHLSFVIWCVLLKLWLYIFISFYWSSFCTYSWVPL